MVRKSIFLGNGTVVCAPGAWGNRSEAIVAWWFASVIKTLKAAGIVKRVVYLTYEGRTIHEIVANAIRQLDEADVGPGVCILTYSYGAQVSRGIAVLRPDLFVAEIRLAGLERDGFRMENIVKVFLTDPWLVIKALFGTVYVPSVDKLAKLFFVERYTPADHELVEMQDHMHLEQFWWKVAQVFLPLPWIRVTMPPLPPSVKVIACFGKKDLLIGMPEYEGENVVMRVPVMDEGHGVIRSRWLEHHLTGLFTDGTLACGSASAAK